MMIFMNACVYLIIGLRVCISFFGKRFLRHPRDFGSGAWFFPCFVVGSARVSFGFCVLRASVSDRRL